MKSKQSLLFILVGVACATLAVVILRKYMGGPAKPPPKQPGMHMLVATESIGYGERIVLDGKDANVRFVSNWPKALALEGAFTDPEAFSERDLRAVDDLVKHQPVIEAHVVDEEDFIPSDMTVQKLPADSRDVQMAGIRPGMIVDVFRMEKRVPHPFMKNVRVYAIGRLDRNRKPIKEKDPPPDVHILVDKDDQLAFMTAVAGKKLKIIEAAEPTGEGPLLVDASVHESQRRDEANAILESARSLMRDGEYERAIAELERVRADYAELESLCQQAAKQADECVKRIAERLYGKAERAFKVDENYSLALEFIDEIERTCADAEEVVRRARALQVSVQEALAANRALVRYRDLLTSIDEALAAGNLPKAGELLAEVEAFSPEDLPEDAAVKSPADAAQEYENRLQDAAGKFKIDRAVVEAHVRQDNVDQARAKLNEMKEEFPAHPDMVELEALVNGV